MGGRVVGHALVVIKTKATGTGGFFGEVHWASLFREAARLSPLTFQPSN
jgi:hypothetical protein